MEKLSDFISKALSNDSEERFAANEEVTSSTLNDQDIKDRKQDREQRKTYAICIFVFLCVYMVAVFVILFFSGFRLIHLSDGVLLMLLGTTFVNVLGLFNLVIRYLFHRKQ